METQTSKPIRKTQAVHFVEGKWCNRCGRFYPYSFFIRNNSTRDGYRKACCFCNAASLKVRNLRTEAWKAIEKLQKEHGAEFIKFRPVVEQVGRMTIDNTAEAQAQESLQPQNQDEACFKDTVVTAETTAAEIPENAYKTGLRYPLAFVSDEELIAEIRRRGYFGELSVKKLVAISI